MLFWESYEVLRDAKLKSIKFSRTIRNPDSRNLILYHSFSMGVQALKVTPE